LDVVGYWWSQRAPDWRPPAALVEFLAAGPPPVFVGFGSMAPDHADQLSALAVGALRAAASAGLHVPGDLSLVGFDDVRAAPLAPVALTTVRQDPRAIGAAAARAVRGGPGAILPVEIVWRASTAPVATYTPPRT
jgi:hypothetical protein